MIAAISQRIVQDDRTGEIRDALSHDWYRFLPHAGFDMVIPIPSVEESADLWIKQLKPDVLILSGGNDVHYNQCAEKEASPLSQKRDCTELALIKGAMQSGIPIIGVCRGMQLIHAYYGGALVSTQGHAGTSHMVKYRFLKEDEWMTDEENSYHRLCIGGRLADHLEPIAYSLSDGSIEAFVHRSYPLLGMMWHPERNHSFKQRDIHWFTLLASGTWKGYEV